MTGLNFDKVNRCSVQFDIATLLGLKTPSWRNALWISSSQSTRRPVRSTDKVIEFGADVRGTLRVVEISQQNNPKPCAGPKVSESTDDRARCRHD
jgi:hypothetical protein